VEIVFAADVSPFTGIAANASPAKRLEPSTVIATADILRMVTTTPSIPVRDIATQNTLTYPSLLKAEDVVGQC
jgi:hypothetical protein